MKETTFDQQTLDFFSEQAQCLRTQQYDLQSQAEKIIKHILSNIPDKKLGFTDGDDFTITMLNSNGENETLLVDAILIDENGYIKAIDEKNNEWYVGGLGRTFVQILTEVVAELQREAKDNS